MDIRIVAIARRAGLTLLVFLAFASSALGQSKGIVVVDRAVIWRTDASIVVTVVTAGTVLELTGQSDRWYEVAIPEQLGGRGNRGLIATSQVRLVEGSKPPPNRVLRGSPLPAQTPPPRRPSPQPSAAPVGVRGFAQAGLIAFTARKGFEAIFGEAYGPTFGGGGEIYLRSGAYIQGAIERFRKTGQRVFVFEGTVFPLGIPQTITVQPITVTAGYRLRLRNGLRPYIGGGVGFYQLKEVSPFDEAAERVDERHAGYHAHGGVEFRTPYSWIAPAVEAKFAAVPDALGAGGASAEFDEDDLGGWQLQMKVLIGK